MATTSSGFRTPLRKSNNSTGFVSFAGSSKKNPPDTSSKQAKSSSGAAGGSRPPKRWKKPLLIAGCIVASLVIAAVVYVFTLLSQVRHVSLDESARQAAAEQELLGVAVIEEQLVEQEISDNVSVSDVEQTQLTDEELAAIADQQKKANVTNILLLGVDRRGTGNVGNTDTIIIATLDRNNKKLKLTSLMRDMFVPIPEVGEQRINSAASKGGIGKLLETINTNFMLDMDKYVLVDFRMFEKIVDKLGGVTMTLSAGEVSAANDCIAGLNKQRGLEDFRQGFIMRSGEIKLTGRQALGYARIRHYNGDDYARTNRQFKVLKTIFKKFLGKDLVSQQTMLFDLLPMVETNLSQLEIADLMISAMQMDTEELLHYRLPAEGFYQARSIRGMSVLVPDIPANAKALHDFIFDMISQPDLPEMKIKEKGGAYVPPDYSATPTPEVIEEEPVIEMPTEPSGLPEPTPSNDLPFFD